MPTTSVTTVFDTFFTATINNYSTELQKNFLEYWALVKALMDNYAHKDSSGGRIFQTSAEYGLNATTKFFDGADPFGQEPAQTAQPLMYTWRYLGSAVSMTQTEMLENRGTAALWNIAESRIRQAERTMNLILGQEAYSDGTNYGGKTIVGLAAGISTTPTSDPASGAVGGLSVSSFNFWQNNATTSCGSFAVHGVKGSTDDLVLTAFNNCTDGMAQRPSVIVSDQNTWEYYNRTLLGTIRYTNETDNRTGDLSWRGLDYQGVKWMWDRLAPSGTIYMFDPKYVHFMVDPAFMFKWSEPLTYPNQLNGPEEDNVVSFPVPQAHESVEDLAVAA